MSAIPGDCGLEQQSPNVGDSVQIANIPSNMKLAYRLIRTPFPSSLGTAQLLEWTGRSNRPKVVSAKSSPISATSVIKPTHSILPTECRLAQCPRLGLEQPVSGSARVSTATNRRGSRCVYCSQLRVPATCRLLLLCNYAKTPTKIAIMLTYNMSFKRIRENLNLP